MTQAIRHSSKKTQQSTTNNNGKPLDVVVITDLDRLVIFHGERPTETVYQWQFSEATFETTAGDPIHYDPLAFRCTYFHVTGDIPSASTEEGLGGWREFIEYVIEQRGEDVEAVQ